MLLLFWMICDGLIILLQNNCAIDEGTSSRSPLSQNPPSTSNCSSSARSTLETSRSWVSRWSRLVWSFIPRNTRWRHFCFAFSTTDFPIASSRSAPPTEAASYSCSTFWNSPWWTCWIWATCREWRRRPPKTKTSSLWFAACSTRWDPQCWRCIAQSAWS